MSGTVAYFGNRFLPTDEVRLSLADAGIVFGATVTDFCRTFDRRWFRLEEHLDRFRADCQTCFVKLDKSRQQLVEVAETLLERNGSLLTPGAEMALVTFATPGPIGNYLGHPGTLGPPTLVMHTFPLNLVRYRPFFVEGVSLAIVGTHVASPDDLLPASAKHRSRLHWWRADHLIQQRKDLPPGTLPLLVEPGSGNLTETAIGNFLLVVEGVVQTPPVGSVLDGIGLRVTRSLCHRLGIPMVNKPLKLEDVNQATEAMLTGTAFGLAGVSFLEGKMFRFPGPVTQDLQKAWNREVGLNIREQFLQSS